MTYRVEFSKGARKQFRKLSLNIQERIQIQINQLVIEPRPSGVIKLQNEENLYRIRVGDYRVVYEIFDDILLVTVIKVKHRSQVYKENS
ncbi:type II toxin-antitoxin system RelE/ParE family toxin [Halotia wernerae UHCC 0503]|nr:type II toxin-antitoxin system RelE/ParE family toxin [Halotia wernerae UHCC 0503]